MMWPMRYAGSLLALLALGFVCPAAAAPPAQGSVQPLSLPTGQQTARPKSSTATSGATRAVDQAALLGVTLRGTNDAANELERAVRLGLGEALSLVPADRVVAALTAAPKLAGCTTMDCAQRLAATLGVRYLVAGSVAFDGSDYTIELHLTDGLAGQAMPTLRQRCVLCGWTEARDRAAALAHAVAALALAQSESLPARALVDDEDGAAKRHRVMAPLKWITGAAGVGLIAASAVLFAYDKHAACDLAPGEAHCPKRYNTALDGGLVLGAGVLASAASITLFVLDRKHPQPSKATLAPTVAPGGAGLSFVGVF